MDGRHFIDGSSRLNLSCAGSQKLWPRPRRIELSQQSLMSLYHVLSHIVWPKAAVRMNSEGKALAFWLFLKIPAAVCCPAIPLTEYLMRFYRPIVSNAFGELEASHHELLCNSRRASHIIPRDVVQRFSQHIRGGKILIKCQCPPLQRNSFELLEPTPIESSNLSASLLLASQHMEMP